MPIARVLIANRGEIAVRIIRACEALGIETVLAVSQADRDSLPARLADRAVCIGPAPAARSYLNIPAIVTAALGTGCDAVHPGYGFLAESAGPCPGLRRQWADRSSGHLRSTSAVWATSWRRGQSRAAAAFQP